MLSLGVGLLLAPPAAACSCDLADPARDVHEADAIFIAEPITFREESGGPRNPPIAEWTMTVREVLLGEVDVITVVRTPADGPACGRELTADGAAVAIVAYADDEDGVLTTNSCSTRDAAALRAAAAELGIEPHPPSGVPPGQTIVVGEDVTTPPHSVRSDQSDSTLTLLRAGSALAAIAVAITFVLAFSARRDGGADEGE